MKKSKILLFDIETSKNIVKTFQMWQTNINHTDIIQDWYIISAAWKFLGERKIYSVACTQTGLKKGNDKNVVKALVKAIREADIVIGHNGDKFDIKKLKARMIKHNLKPIGQVKSIDTLKAARREFSFTSNRLDYLGSFLGVGRKIVNETGLWDKVMSGDMTALRKMVKYNKQDVKLLEDVYLRMRPYITNHPDLRVLEDKMRNECPVCTSSNTIKFGKRHLMKVKKVYQRYVCNDCGHSFQGKKPIN